MLPLGYPLLWGREEVILISAAENRQAMGKRGFQQDY